VRFWDGTNVKRIRSEKLGPRYIRTNLGGIQVKTRRGFSKHGWGGRQNPGGKYDLE